MGWPDLTLQGLVFRALSLLLVAGVQGGSMAAAAVLLGDRGPRYDGRLTLAPGSHIDPVGAFGLIVFGLGWTRPPDVEAGLLRPGPAAIVVVILAGSLALLALSAVLGALIVPALAGMSYTAGLTAAAFLRTAASLSIGCALLALFPIPPLAGGLVLGAAGGTLPPPVRSGLAILLLAAVAAGLAGRMLGPLQAALAALVLGG